ncbi:MAG: ester cyclase [Deltaproteobacteria bacterium]|nr:ester cyclase [Deltaproteobacteria bacterium]
MAQQSVIDAAKASILAYGDKNWNGVRASVSPGVLYDEVATHRKMNGVEQLLTVWQGWATAFPDSKATFQNAFSSGNTVVLEVTWRGTHGGPLQTPEGRFPATGKTIEVPACLIIEIGDGKARSMRHYFDMATLMQQLGLAKAA